MRCRLGGSAGRLFALSPRSGAAGNACHLGLNRCAFASLTLSYSGGDEDEPTCRCRGQRLTIAIATGLSVAAAKRQKYGTFASFGRGGLSRPRRSLQPEWKIHGHALNWNHDRRQIARVGRACLVADLATVRQARRTSHAQCNQAWSACHRRVSNPIMMPPPSAPSATLCVANRCLYRPGVQACVQQAVSNVWEKGSHEFGPIDVQHVGRLYGRTDRLAGNYARTARADGTDSRLMLPEQRDLSAAAELE